MTSQRSLPVLVSCSMALLVAISGRPAAAPTLRAETRTTTAAIADLADGSYQICSQPDPQNWQDGAGVCLNFVKTQRELSGYYGYPHSNQFVCIRGQVEGNRVIGEALIFAWEPGAAIELPPTPLVWDDEGHLTLHQGHLTPAATRQPAPSTWIHFRRAILDVTGFYRYPTPRMKPAAELCPWHPSLLESEFQRG